VKSIYNSKVAPNSSNSYELSYELLSAIKDPEFLAALLCMALCESEPYDLNDEAMCKITPDFYADTMNAEVHEFEDTIMMAFYSSINRVRVKFGKPTIQQELDTGEDTV
jgi:hypothetical protein